MISVRDASAAQAESWLDDWRSRLHAWYARADISEEWTRSQVERRVTNHVGSAVPSVFVLTSDGCDVGLLAAAQTDKHGPPTTVVTDVWIDPRHRRQGHAAAALRWARSWAAPYGQRFALVTDPADPAQSALSAPYPVRAQNMYKRASNVHDLGVDLSGHPMTTAEYEPWRARQAEGYAEEMASSGLLSQDDAIERAETQLNEFLPQGLRTVNHAFWLLRSGAEVVADLWLMHHYQPDTTLVSGVGVDEAQRGKGYGRTIMQLGERATVSSSDTHIGLNVFGHNTVAINLYNRLGYVAIDQSRSINL